MINDISVAIVDVIYASFGMSEQKK